MNEICWLPELEYLAQYENIWSIYESALYSIFKSDFIDSYPLYKNTRVNVKHYPIEYGKEEAFFHTTCKDYTGNGARVPDFRRCERIRWVRAFIENYDCHHCNSNPVGLDAVVFFLFSVYFHCFCVLPKRKLFRARK